jgi:Fe-S-cluster containining protein
MRETEIVAGTSVQIVVDRLDEIYADVASSQEPWKLASPFQCADGCGSCCVDFEPDVLECEALYLAVWMLSHQSERAEAILTGTFVSPREGTSAASHTGCLFFDPESPYHCTVYDGRCLICRLFGYTGDRGKDGKPRWKPCKFLPLDELDHGDKRRHQYEETELLDRFGTVPPVMSDITAQVVALSPDTTQTRRPLREALPDAIAKIRMLARFSRLPDPDTPEPNPEAPMPRAS